MPAEIRLPDVGDFSDVEVIEVHVGVGDRIAKEDPIITLETDKASMDVPAPQAGTIAAMQVKVGDKISKGDVLALLADSDEPAAAPMQGGAVAAEPHPGNAAGVVPAPSSAPPPVPAPVQAPAAEAAPSADPAAELTVEVPDIGGFEDVAVIDVASAAGDQVAAEDSLITLESDKASMDVPSPLAGKIVRMLVKAGDKVSQGSPIAVIQPAAGAAAPAAPAQLASPPASQPAEEQSVPASHYDELAHPASSDGELPMPGHELREGKPHASPAVRKLAREFGANLAEIKASGPKGRILKEDVQAHIKARLETARGGGLGNFGYQLPEADAVDFAEFGPVEEEKLSRIRQISGPVLHRNWLTVPHVTQFDEADVTELEKFRKEHVAEARENAFRLSALAFLVQACTVALRKHPRFNCSLSPDGASVILKRYCNIGIAVNTAAGLLVPVIRDADTKTVMQIAEDMAALSARAREGKLGPREMRGGTFTISSLGGIGGTHFTPIVNYPEVAILGVGRTQTKPVHDGQAFVPRLMMPLALSYDHRVVDGAEGATFITFLSSLLSDIRNVLL